MSNNEKLSKETTVTTTELALILGLSARRIQQMAQDGSLQTVSRGRFNLADSVQGYIKFVTKDPVTDEDVKLERTKRTAEASLKASKAQIAKMEASELQGKMHRAEDVQTVIEALIFTVRSSLMALPGRLAMDVSGASTAAEAADVIRKEVVKLMQEIASFKYDPEEFAQLVRERRKWGLGDPDDD